MKNLRKTLLTAAALMGFALPVLAAQPTPTVPTFQCSVDNRRNPDCDVLIDGSWVNAYDVPAGGTISITAPTGYGTTPMIYYLSPQNPSGHYLVRNMGETPIANLTSSTVTDGSAWELDRANGHLGPAATVTSTRWLGYHNLNSYGVSVTAAFASAISQTTR